MLRKVFERVKMRGRMNTWIRQVEKYMGDLALSWGDVESMDESELVRAVRRWDLERWSHGGRVSRKKVH